jgi:hypothetical protein
MDPSISTEPRLPTELESLIFGIIALSHPVGIPNLMLVAWRVRQWYVTVAAGRVIRLFKGDHCSGLNLLCIG